MTMINKEEKNYNLVYDLNSDKWFIIFLEHKNQFGFEKQLTKLIEELGELVKISAKLKGNKENDKNDTKEQIHNFHVEILDVQVMVTQFIKMYLNEDEIKDIMIDIYVRACERVGLIP